MSEKAIFFDASNCTACKGCQVACKTWNELPSPLELNANSFTGSYQAPADLNGDTRLIVTFDEHDGGSKGVEWAFGRRACQHCSDAPCVEVCPSSALYQDEETGFVGVDESLCIGCKYCEQVCPFDVPRYHDDIINKCSACLDRIEEGREPACVTTCQPEALKFGDRDEMIALAHSRVEDMHTRGFTDAIVYGENEMNGMHVIYATKYALERYGFPEDPQPKGFVGATEVMKPLVGAAAVATVVGLGVSLASGHGYHRDTLRYDENTGETIDVDTGEVIKKTPVNAGEEK